MMQRHVLSCERVSRWRREALSECTRGGGSRRSAFSRRFFAFHLPHAALSAARQDLRRLLAALCSDLGVAEKLRFPPLSRNGNFGLSERTQVALLFAASKLDLRDIFDHEVYAAPFGPDDGPVIIIKKNNVEHFLDKLTDICGIPTFPEVPR
jgi:hypothetical protein